MGTLTWQDVAGQVRAPDYGDAANLITQGISGLGQSVAALGAAPDQRRQAAAAKELQIAQLKAGMSESEFAKTDKFFNDQTVRTEKKDAKEFGKNQSKLEAAFRTAALNGQSYESVLESDLYKSLGEGAQAYGASHLSDAYMRGDETRMTRAEQAADNARQEAHFQAQQRQQAASFALQKQQFGQSVKESDARIAAVLLKNREDQEARGIYSKDAGTNIAIQDRLMQVGKQFAPLLNSKEKYGAINPKAAAKLGGLDDTWYDAPNKANEIMLEVQRKTGKQVEPWMVNQLLAEGGVAHLSSAGINNTMAEDYLTSLVKQQDAYTQNQIFVNEMVQLARNGQKFDAGILNSGKYMVNTGIDAPIVVPQAQQRQPGYNPKVRTSGRIY